MDVKAWVAMASLPIFLLSHCCLLSNAAAANKGSILLDRIRDVLVRQEDTIVFSLIERANFPINSKAYAYDEYHPGSLAQLYVRQTEALEAKFGRYENPEEIPFFPTATRSGFVPPYNSSKTVIPLHPAGSGVNVSSEIWEFYMKKILPLMANHGEPDNDDNYASTLASDLTCLQALARRIHYGRFVAEAKFRESPHLYIPPIRSDDQKTLNTLLTDHKVEEMVKERVAKKAMVFGQDVTLLNTSTNSYKVDPKLVSRLYNDWVIPLTKLVELQYLLRRLH
ncbi:hypothetical protein V2J09_011327 [Rumex salicifolius]